MSLCSGNKCSEEEELDLFYLEIEERILLLISEEEEEVDRAKKTKRAPLLPLSGNTRHLPSNKSSFIDASWYNNSFVKQLQATKQRRGHYGTVENIGKKNERWIHEYGARRMGGRGTGVFIPKSASLVGSATLAYHN